MAAKKKITKKKARALVAKYRKAYPEVACVTDNAFAPHIDPSKYPRTKAAYRAVLMQETMNAASDGYRRGSDDTKTHGIHALEQQAQTARINGIKEVTELSKSLTKMAYMLMMTLNGGKPFHGS